MSLLSVVAHAKEPEQLWSIDLAEAYGFGHFEAEPNNWLIERGMFFVSSGRLVVYQVLEDYDASLAGRKSTEGGRIFHLQLEVLDTADGHEIRHLRLSTGSRGDIAILRGNELELLRGARSH